MARGKGGANLGNTQEVWKGTSGDLRLSYSQQEYTVNLGDTDVYHQSHMAVQVPARDIVIHKDFSVACMVYHDIALVLLSFPVTFSEYIQLVCLPPKSFRVENGTLCWVTGWGRVLVDGEPVPRMT